MNRRAVRPDPIRSVPVNADGTMLVHFYADGEVRFEHVCKDIGEGERLVCAPALQIGAGHSIVCEAPLTIVASILCADCGTHGFVTEGMWRPC